MRVLWRVGCSRYLFFGEGGQDAGLDNGKWAVQAFPDPKRGMISVVLVAFEILAAILDNRGRY